MNKHVLYFAALLLMTICIYRLSHTANSPALIGSKTTPDALINSQKRTDLKRDTTKTASHNPSVMLVEFPSPTDNPDTIKQWLLANVKTRPDQVITWISMLPDDHSRYAFARYLADNLARENPVGAAAWAQRFPDDALRIQTLEGVCTETIRTNTRAALAIAQQYDFGDQKSALMEKLVNDWAGRDATTALAWAKTIPDETLRATLIGRIASVMAQADPATAADLVVSELEPGPAGNQAAIQVINQWAQRDPASAAEWVSRFPDGELYLNAVKQIAAAWAVTDSPAAKSWLQTLPSHEAQIAGELAIQKAGLFAGANQ